MKRSTKVISIIIVFFLIIASVIVARTMIGKHFQKKFGKRPPPGIIVTEVVDKEFSEKIETFGTAVSNKTKSFRIKKEDLIGDLKLNSYVKKGDVILIESPQYTNHQWEVYPFLFSCSNKEIKLNWENSDSRWIRISELNNFTTVPSLDRVLGRLF